MSHAQMSVVHDERSGPAPSGMLVVIALMVAAVAGDWGMFGWGSLALAVGALALCFRLHLAPRLKWPSAEAMLLGVVVAFVAMTCFLKAGMSEQRIWSVLPFSQRRMPRLNGYGIGLRLLGAVALVLTVTYLIQPAARLSSWRRRRFLVLAAIAVAMRVLMLFSSPSPKIDVFELQTQGAKAVLSGENLYRIDRPAPIPLGGAVEHYGYPYPPETVYPIVLSWVLFKDVRVAWLFCDLLAAFLLYRLARRVNPGTERVRFRELATLAVLFFPRALHVVDQSWTEPLIAVTLAAYALAIASGRRTGILGVLLGLWLGSKQYVAVAALPAIKYCRRFSVWALGLGTAVAVALPFILWDVHALFNRTIVFFVKSPSGERAFSLYTALLRSGWEMPWWLVVPVWVAGAVWFTWKMQRCLPGWLFSTACVWFFFFMFGKQSALNYYYVIAFTMLLAVAASPVDEVYAGDAAE